MNLMRLMISTRWFSLFCLLTAFEAFAQNEPHLGYVYPAGGRQGTTFEATLGGRYLDVTNVFFSGAGVAAAVINQERQLRPADRMAMQDALAKFQQKRRAGEPVTQEEINTAQEMREKIARFGRRPENPSLGEFVTVRVTIAPGAALGNREVRVLTRAGLSNPLIFTVGELPEFSKNLWKNMARPGRNGEAQAEPATLPINVTLPATINGQIPPGGVDRYRFLAEEGRQIVVDVRARELIPYISDAVPGWFQAIVRLSDANGKEVAYADDFRFRPDPVLFYKVPAAGEYILEIKDSLYRGREDFVYRVTVGELPFMTAVSPLGGRIGSQTNLAVTGWNLPFDTMPLDLRNKEPGIYPLSKKPAINHVDISADSLPEIFEQEPNNTAETAQSVVLPAIINGCIDKPGDMDVYAFDSKEGDKIVADVYARRLDSPLDSLLVLTDSTGKQIAFNDDHEDKGSGLNTHHADSYIACTIPASGRYFIHIGDTQHGGGPAHGYRLRISSPRPDFALRVTPSSLNVHSGASVPITVHVLRRDGFSGPIRLNLKGATQGLSLSGAQVPEGQDQMTFTLNVASQTRFEIFDLRMEGRAKIDGREVVREAVPADDMMQAFAYRHLVPAQELKVAVVGPFRNQRNAVDRARILSALPLRIQTNGTVSVSVHLPVGPRFSKVQYELSDAPDGIHIKDSYATNIVFQADPEKVRPGTNLNLIVKVSAQPPAPAGGATNAVRRSVALGTLPAIPVEVLP